MTNEKKSSMSAEQKLYPQLIYRINSTLSDIKSDLEKDYKEGELFIAPSVLDSYTRTFNWLMVNDEKWKFLDTEERKDIENLIKSNWEQFEKEFIHRKEMKTVSDAIDIIKESDKKSDEDYHFALLSIYQFYPNDPKKYIDGIIYRNLARRAKERKGKNHRINYAQVTLRCEEENKKTYILYPWVEIKFFDNEVTQEIKYSCQEFNPSDPKKGIKKGYPADDNPDIDKPEEIRPVETETEYKKAGWGALNPATPSVNHFYWNYFVPYFVNDEGFNPREFYKLSPEYLSQRKYINVIPVYDALYGEYGNLCAVLQIPFVDQTERDKFKEKNILIKKLPFLVNEIKNAAFFEILKQPIESDDLLEHFVKYLPMLQDWEFIRVFQIKNSDEVLLNYCYRRREEDPEKGKWKRCEKNYKECENDCSIKVNNDGILEDKELSKKLVEDKKKHIPCDEINFGKGHKHKSLLENIFTERYIPELDEYDKSKCENKIVIYEYPSYTIIPDNELTEHPLGLYYERQQIDLLRQLAIKRKVMLETIRHGTRAAVAAIMARNMSHNLGSHILGYLSSESQADGKFYRYLQGRMDFIADISTRKPSWSSTVTFIEEIMNPFIGFSDKDFISPHTNVKIINNILRSIAINDENKRICLDAKKIRIIVNVTVDGSIATESSCQIIYTYHSGNDEYIICKKNKDFRDISLDIPHGSVGMHAFYSILENFLRNSARHGGDEINEILRNEGNQFECFIDIVSYNENLYKVTLKDNLRKPDPDHVKSIIDSYITGEHARLINNDGNINREGWGIKEMRISAAWLRGIEPKEVHNFSLEPPLLKPIITENQELGYEFYLLKPLEVLIVTKDPSIEANPNEGIYVKNTAEELSALIKNNTLRHKCVVFDNPNDKIKKWIKGNDLSLPFSIFCNVSIEKGSTFMYRIDRTTYCNGNVKNNLYAELRKIVVNKYFANEEVKLCFFEDTLRKICGEKSISAITDLKDITNRCIVFNHDYKEKDSFELQKIYNNKPVFYQPYYSTDTTGRRIRELVKREGACGIDKIYIGTLSKIVFADERLFSKMQTKSENEYLYKKWKRMGVEFVDIKRDQDKVIVYANSENSAIDWNLYIDQKSNQVTFFSIHQSTIKDVITEKSWGKMAADLNKNNNFITIHTGRAAINVTSGFKYLEFSNIENILDNFDKLRLVELFFHEVRGL